MARSKVKTQIWRLTFFSTWDLESRQKAFEQTWGAFVCSLKLHKKHGMLGTEYDKTTESLRQLPICRRFTIKRIIAVTLFNVEVYQAALKHELRVLVKFQPH